ncbi:MAG TPA: hypothetical protein VK709_09655 [Candidatus Saccharimonadales bacterium]|jgi:hypothetical protein|nr:hypothetical protein [Candidatus Saccharimonadales bacterium]
MQLEAAQMLVSAIAEATTIAIDNRNKLVALEVALQKYEPNLFQTYSKTLDELRLRPPLPLSHEVLANLQARLVQDQS